MKNNKSIYTIGKKTYIEFGRGRICVAKSTGEEEYKGFLFLGDTFKDRQTEITEKEFENGGNFDTECPGNQIILCFNKLESVLVVSAALNEITEMFLKKNKKDD